MTRFQKKPRVQFNIRVREDLFIMFCKLCLDYGISRAEGIEQYFKYLNKHFGSKRKLLDDKTKDATFTLEPRSEQLD